MLELDDFSAAYGDLIALRRVGLYLAPGQLALVVGRNGSGRSTLLQALMGLLERTGRYQLHGVDRRTALSWDIAADGVGYSPDTRDIFGSLSTGDNLQVAPVVAQWCDRARLLDAFPRLRERERVLAGRLSGGEQKLLSIARSALRARTLWLLDEPFEGLAADMVERVKDLIALARAAHVAVVVVDRDIHQLATMADVLLVLGAAEMQYCGAVKTHEAQAALQEWLDTDVETDDTDAA